MCDASPHQRPGASAAAAATLSRREALQRAGVAAAALTVGRYFLKPSPAAASSAPAAGAAAAPKLQLAVVRPNTPAQVAALARFDDTHARPEGAVELLLWPGDRERLDELGFDYTVTVPDVVARAEQQAASAPVVAPKSRMPGGNRTEYRRLPDYMNELQKLAKDNPRTARLIELRERSIEGRPVFGIEIGKGAGSKDGRPMAYFDGIHHAREWPAAEYPMIFAHYLLEGYGKNPRITKLLNRGRVAIVPVVNPDGFNYSREFPIEDPGGWSSIVVGGQGAYWRKNRRQQPVDDHPPNGEVNPVAYGVDPNRNYPYLWGATTGGALGLVDDFPVEGSTSPFPLDATYYGHAPLSEPETRNVAHYLMTHNVTGMITNHTYGGLVLRPWGHTEEDPVDAELLKAIGDRMGRILAYTSQIGLGLYATTGTTDDWYYAATGSLGFTLEHGKVDFHPPYASPGQVVTYWERTMQAFMVLAEAAVDAKKHSVLEGRVVNAGGKGVPAKLTLRKSFDVPTEEPGVGGIGPALNGSDSTPHTLELELETGRDGAFEWHLNPSTRPTVAEQGKKEKYEVTISASGGKSVRRKVFLRRGQRLHLGRVVLG